MSSSALFFSPDGYIVEGRQIMGRRTAGASFLRAMVEGRGGEPVVGYGPNKADEPIFADAVRRIDPAAEVGWIAPARFDLLLRIGSLFVPGPGLSAEARLRLRAGPASYSLCGITHTISSAAALNSIAALVTEPLMPWDALICTSAAAQAVVRDTLDDAIDQLRWRLGSDFGTPRLPQLPVIPLGVHCRDWTPSEAARREARSRLALGEEEVAILFAGRLSIAGKAHPFQMLEALQRVAEATGLSLTLVLAGQYFNDAVEKAFVEAVRTQAPGIRSICADGADASLYAATFAGADIFVSLADSTQESFGLTPVEAMAAGLPVLVSDWDGYRDTVRDGIDGFRVPSWAPSAGSGKLIALAYEAAGDFELYSSRKSTTVSLDMGVLVERLGALTRDPGLRRRMGAAGQARALADYDWAVVYRRYRQLWAELEAMRRHALADPSQRGWIERAPRAHVAYQDPFRRFASYPTKPIAAATMVRAGPGASRAVYEALAGLTVFSLWRIPPAIAESVIAAASEPAPVEQIAHAIGQEVGVTIELVARLAKMNLLILG